MSSSKLEPITGVWSGAPFLGGGGRGAKSFQSPGHPYDDNLFRILQMV